MSGQVAFIFGSLDIMEIMVIGMAALMIFGGQLPEVALRCVAQVMRARRAVSRMWRETGLEDELRRVRRDIENSVPRTADFDLTPKGLSSGSGSNSGPKSKAEEARAAAEKARAAARKNAEEAKARKAGGGADAYGGDVSDLRPADGVADGEAGGGLAPEESNEFDPDADRREPFTFEPMEDAIAKGDDWSAGTGSEPEPDVAAVVDEPTALAPTPRLGQFGEGVPDDRP